MSKTCKYNKKGYGQCCPRKELRCYGCEGIPFPFYSAPLSYENENYRCYICCDTGIEPVPLVEFIGGKK